MKTKAPEYITVTRDHLTALRTGGSFTTATVRGLGISHKEMVKGWAQALVGKRILRSQLEAGLAGVGVYAKSTLGMRFRGRGRKFTQDEGLEFDVPPAASPARDEFERLPPWQEWVG